MDNYTKAFEAKMVQRMLEPNAVSIRELARKTGVGRSTLQLWKLAATGKESWSDRVKKRRQEKKAQVPRRPEDWSAAERLRVVNAAAGLSDEGLGELLRREGLHQATLNEWERDALEGLSASKGGAQAKRIAELERQLLRKDRALAETAALLVLQKKVQALWAVADDDIDEPTESKSSSSSTKPPRSGRAPCPSASRRSTRRSPRDRPR